MNWEAFRDGMFGVVRWICYGLGAFAFIWMWKDKERKSAWIATAVLAGVMLVVGIISGYELYIGAR